MLSSLLARAVALASVLVALAVVVPATSSPAGAAVDRCPHAKRALTFAVRHPQAGGQANRLIGTGLPRGAVTTVQTRAAGAGWRSVAVRQTTRCGRLSVRITSPWEAGACELWRTRSRVVVDRDHARIVRTRAVRLCSSAA